MSDFAFVKETPDGWIYEGLAIPYGGPADGQDLTGSHFTAKSDLCLDWFPAGGRPLLYRHGFDAALKASVVGREIGAVREDAQGRWYQIQIDRAKEYAAEIKQLADEGLLALSSGAVDHLARIAAKTGEIQVWPWVELSLVPNPANPEALVYQVKSTDAVEHLDIVETPVPAAVTEDAETEAPVEPPEEPAADEPAAEPATPAEDEPDTLTVASTDAVREGRRNSTADVAALQAAHDALATVLSLDCSSGAGKAAPPAPRLVVTTGTVAEKEVDLVALKAEMSAVATTRAKELLRIS